MSVYQSVHPSICMEQLDSHIFMKFDTSIFLTSVQKIQFSLKSNKNNGYVTRRPTYVDLWHRAQFFLEWEMFWIYFPEKIKTHVLCSTNFFPEDLAVYEIMWKNMVQPNRPQVATWRMRFACWITKATDTHSEYVISIAFALQKWLNEGFSMLHLYVHGLYCKPHAY